MKGHPRYCSYWEKEATGDDRKKGKWGLEADRTGQKLEPAPRSAPWTAPDCFPSHPAPTWVLLGLMQKHLKPSPLWLCHKKYFLTIKECDQMR